MKIELEIKTDKLVVNDEELDGRDNISGWRIVHMVVDADVGVAALVIVRPESEGITKEDALAALAQMVDVLIFDERIQPGA